MGKTTTPRGREIEYYATVSLVPEETWVWPNFSPEEFACRGSGKVAFCRDALDKLQQLRNKLGYPVQLTSAYRSPAYNKQVGGASKSWHMEGCAFDVVIAHHDPHAFIAAAEAVGFTGIGTYPAQGFIHIDTRPDKARWGEPFPADRRQAPTPRMPRASLAQSGTLRGLTTGAVGTGITAVADPLTQALTAAQGSAEAGASVFPYLHLVGLAITLAGLGYAAYRRWKDWKEGAR